MSVCRAVQYQQLPLAPGMTPVQAPPGVRLRTLGREETGAWLALSNAAFPGHPENGGWTNEGLAWRLASPWTALDRFVVAADAVTDRLLGGVWTKVMPGSGEAELYVVAVHPDWTGRGVPGPGPGGTASPDGLRTAGGLAVRRLRQRRRLGPVRHGRLRHPSRGPLFRGGRSLSRVPRQKEHRGGAGK